MKQQIFPLLPHSGSFGVTKKAKAGRLGVGGPPLFLPKFPGRPGKRRQNPLRRRPKQPSSRDPMQKTSDINVVETRPLPSPATLLAEIPKTEAQAGFRHAHAQGHPPGHLHGRPPPGAHRWAVLHPRRGRGPGIRRPPGCARARGLRPRDGRHARLLREAEDHGRLEGPHHGPAPRRLARHRRRPADRARLPARRDRPRASDGHGAARSRDAPVHRGPRVLVRDRRAHRGVTDPPPDGLGPLHADRVQERDRRLRPDRDQRNPCGIAAADVPRHQPRRRRVSRRDRRESQLPHRPARGYLRSQLLAEAHRRDESRSSRPRVSSPRSWSTARTTTRRESRSASPS
jgi:hypothetical protein